MRAESGAGVAGIARIMRDKIENRGAASSRMLEKEQRRLA